MASTTPSATPEAATLMKFDSPFNSRSLIITVGPHRTPFTMHEAKLAETCFFEVHGPPVRREFHHPEHHHDTDGNSDLMEVKLENGTVELVRSVKSDFHLEDRFLLDPPAFDVFTKHLYNEPPKKPTVHKQLRTLCKAYGIATKYKCYSLQNKILECVRQYYGRTQIRFDDVIWCINRFGDNTNCPLTGYMVEQTAFEIANGGFQEFCTTNILMKPFLEQGDRAVRVALVEALARHGQHTTAGDPSSGPSKFSVWENGVHQGQLRQ